MEILKGINSEYLIRLMAAWGLRSVLKDHIWFEKFGPYKVLVLVSDLPKNEIILKVANYFKDNKPSSIDDITIREYILDDKNLYLPRKVNNGDPRKIIYNILIEEPLLEYIYDTLFIHPYIQGKNIAPIQFAKESQRDSAKMGYDAKSRRFPLACNIIMHNLMWIAINEYIVIREIDSFKDIKNVYNSKIGFYFIKNYCESLRGSVKLLIPVFGKDEILFSKLYRQTSLGGDASTYAFWKFERNI